MSPSDLASLAPELLLCAAGVAALLIEAFTPRLRNLLTPLAAAAVIGAAWLAWRLPDGSSFGGQLEASAATFAFSCIVLVAALLAILSSDGFLRRAGILGGEYHALLLWCSVGLLLMLRATELLTLFVALETLSLCLYALAAYHRRSSLGSEAGIKYFLMGAFVSAFVLLGLALLYGETGSTRLADVAAALGGGVAARPLATLGVLLLVSGFGFKMSVVPFHAWSPDTYQGAPSPFVAFLSVAPKVASALVLVRVLTAVAEGPEGEWSDLVALLAVLSMVVGNLLALVQRDIKRMLAYSGIAHMGYLLIAFTSLDAESWAPVITYLLAYALMNAGAFGAVAMLYPASGEEHPITELSGLGYRYPLLGACLAVSMVSLGGIPPTMGFLGKYLVFLHAVRSGRVGLAVVGAVASLVAIFYYLRVVYTLYMKVEKEAPEPIEMDGWGRLAAVLATAGTLLLGVWPWRLLRWMYGAVAGLS